ncbi:MAG TPA: NAD(P)-dependent oxidoreductase [Bacteroidota bacterium]|nr:NAD(P)-dependent oxidoreductase [Bacteroidota bacterium]
MKVLIADAFPEKYIGAIKDLGLEVEYKPKLKSEELAANIGTASILVVRSTEVKADCITTAPALTLIIRAGAGVNTIDIASANERGIYVTNCPGKNSIAVAELAMGLLLALDRRIADNVIDLRAGKWNKGEYSKADGIYGKTLGLIGVGQIGKEMIPRAKAFGLRVIGWSRSLTREKAAALGIDFAGTVPDLVAQCDIISVHVALKPETRGLISRSIIEMMKPGTIFINTSRAEVVDEEALADAAAAGKIKVGTDVFVGEPEEKAGSFKSRLAMLPNVYGTHHIGASTEQAQNAVAEETVAIIREYVQQGTVRNWVNRAKKTAARWQLVVRHYDRPGVLANVLGDLKSSNINVEEMENVIFDGGKTACATIRVAARPSDEVLKRMQDRRDEVIQITLNELT